VNEKPSEEPTATITTDSDVKMTPEQLATITITPIGPIDSSDHTWAVEETVIDLLHGAYCEIATRRDFYPNAIRAYNRLLWQWELSRANTILDEATRRVNERMGYGEE
jgi:hypothetical protein